MKINRRPVAQRLREAMAELEAAMQSDRPLNEIFSIRTVEIAAPAQYSTKAIRAMRAKLRVSQRVFAELLGVSVQLVEHWEQGICRPRSMARRLLDEVNRDPEGFLLRHLTSAHPLRKTG